MAPRTVSSQNRHKLKIVHNNIYAKRLNRSLMINALLRKRNALLSLQNIELSTTVNSLLQKKLSLENENNSVKNSNKVQTATNFTISKKLGVLEQTLQKYRNMPESLVQCVPSLLDNIHDIMSKIYELNEYITKDKKRQTNAVRPMINGITIYQPAVTINRLKLLMEPVIGSPSSEPTPKRVSNRSSPNHQHDLVPYVRLKDVAVMLKNSKAVPHENSPKRQPNENLGEGPSWLYNQEIQTQNTDNDNSISQIHDNYPVNVSNEVSTPIKTEITRSRNIHVDISTPASSSSSRISNTVNDTEMCPSEIISPAPLIVLNNKRKKSIVLDVEHSTSRPKRTIKKINYKELLQDKLTKNNYTSKK